METEERGNRDSFWRKLDRSGLGADKGKGNAFFSGETSHTNHTCNKNLLTLITDFLSRGRRNSILS